MSNDIARDQTNIPKITVIIPAYNEKDYIDECLDSVLIQRDLTLEVIVVDDLSTDGTFEILEQRAKLDNRIKLYRNERNMGNPSFGRNLGIKLASGEWIAIVDADDKLLDENFLARMAEKMCQSESDIGYCGFLTENPLQNYKPYFNNYKNHSREALNFAHMDSEFWHSTPHGAAFKMYRRSFLSDNNLFFPDLPVEDQPFFVISLFLARKICLDPSIAYYYRQKKLLNTHRYNRYNFKNYAGNLASMQWILLELNKRKVLIKSLQEELAIIMYKLFNVPNIKDELNLLLSHRMQVSVAERKAIYDDMRTFVLQLWTNFSNLEYKFFGELEREDLKDFLELDFYEYAVVRGSKNDVLCRKNLTILSEEDKNLRLLISKSKNLIIGMTAAKALQKIPRIIRYPLALIYLIIKTPISLYRAYSAKSVNEEQDGG